MKHLTDTMKHMEVIISATIASISRNIKNQKIPVVESHVESAQKIVIEFYISFDSKPPAILLSAIS